MKKFLKLYWPMIVSVAFMVLYGIIFGVTLGNDALFESDAVGIFLVILTFLFVIAVYGEMIFFIIKACKHKELKNKGLWCVCLYFFHMFVFPYFHLRYVCGEEKLKPRMFLFAFLGIIAFLIGLYIPVGVEENVVKKPLIIEEDDVIIEFPAGYRETEIGQYDFYAKDTKRLINFGGFVYDEDDNDTADEIIRFRDSWIKSSRDSVELIDTIKEETLDSIITTNIYIGSNEGTKNMYYISVIEFKNTNCFVNVISTYLHEDYLDYKNELLQILDNMQYIED